MVQEELLRGRLTGYMLENGLKNTRQRQVIFDCFVEANDHLSLDALLARVQRKMPGVGYATVYRTMKLFTSAGIAHERRFLEGQSQYEPVDLVNHHHDHLICENCGKIFEFEDDEIERRQTEVAAEFGLRLTHHRLEMWGLCLDTMVCEARKRKGKEEG